MVSYKWYALRVKSGKEEKIKVAIETAFDKQDIQSSFEKIMLPFEKVYVMRKGKKEIKKRYLSYLFISLDLQDKRVKHILDTIEGVQGFVGLSGWGNKEEPISLPAHEVERMFGKVDHPQTQLGRGDQGRLFSEGETVKVIDGAFQGTTAVIKKISSARKKITALIKIFDSLTDTELSYNQIEKLNA